jgi:hypothetical protein
MIYALFNDFLFKMVSLHIQCLCGENGVNSWISGQNPDRVKPVASAGRS